MADISKIQIEGIDYSVKDETARDSIPTKTSELENDSGFITAEDIPESSSLTKAQIKALDEMFKIASYTENPATAYETFREAFGLDEAVKMTGITATYNGGDVMEGSALHELTDIVVVGIYGDGTTKEITNYTLSGIIGEGASTVTVTYEDFTTTFTVVGIPIETLYQEVEYIEFDGQSYIVTDKGPANNFEHDVIASFPAATSEQAIVSFASSTGGWGNIGFSAKPNRMFFNVETSAAITNIENLYTSIVHAHATYNYEVNKTFTLNVDGKEYSATDVALVDFSRAEHASRKFVIGSSGSATARLAFIGKIYHISYTANDVLVCDLIPCYRKSDNEVGLYDKVNGMFYANAGTGTLTAGGNV